MTGKFASPGEALAEMMKERGWTQLDLATILGKPQRSISEIITGKKAVTPETAIALSDAFGNVAEFWLQLESSYRLSLVATADTGVSKRAKLYEIAPVKEMAKRGWITSTDDPTDLEAELCRFFGQDDLTTEPQVCASLRSSIEGNINAAQRAWCFRAMHLARAQRVAPYDESKWTEAVKKLRRLAAWPDHAARVPSALASMGIRFVVIEPLMKTRIDGAAFWLDEDSPVVALSARYDRIDSFWHTLGHELSHIKHRDATTLDIDLVGENRRTPLDMGEVERRADSEASAFWLDPDELQSFIVRVGPLYSRDRINQFANRIKVHPGIIVGQLQYRGELSYRNLRDTLVKIRDHVTSEAITDGWGNVISA